MSTVVDSKRRDLFPLPDSSLVFGLGGERRHAVTREMALRAIGDGLIRDAVAGAVCGAMVQLAAKWGPYERDSKYLAHGRVCVACAWIIAGARDELPAQIAAAKPAQANIDVITDALGDPLAGIRLLEAIAADDDLDDSLVGHYRRSHKADLLAHAARHLPAITICEECADGGDYGHDDEDSCAAALCMTCTASSGPWAGEWEGYTLDECVVAAPCSVLRAMCNHYKIALP